MIAQACALIELVYPQACVARYKIVKQLQEQLDTQKYLYVYKGACAGAPLFVQDQAHLCLEQALHDSKRFYERYEKVPQKENSRGLNNLSHDPALNGQKGQVDAIQKNCIHVQSKEDVEKEDLLQLECLPVKLDLCSFLRKRYDVNIQEHTPVIYIFKTQVTRCISAPIEPLKEPLESVDQIKKQYEKQGWCTNGADCLKVAERLAFINDVQNIQQLTQALIDCKEPMPYSALFARALYGTYVNATELQGVLVLDGPVWTHHSLLTSWE